MELDRLLQFIETHSLEKCPVCGEAEWVRPGAPHVLIDVIPERSKAKAKGLPVLAMVCGHCSFVRLHAVKMLEKQLEAQEA